MTRRAGLLSLLFAVIAAAYLLVAPIVRTATTGVDGEVIREQTLLEVSGPGVLFGLAAPVVFAALPLLAPRRGVRVISAVLLAAIALLGLASIGLLFVPSAVAMSVAASVSPSRSDARRRPVQRGG